uniref:Uncharacterized protein n=1 Tax=viral metagenome TaxID=1070528 RepID=A0A6C0LZV8_9ZZZZ
MESNLYQTLCFNIPPTDLKAAEKRAVILGIEGLDVALHDVIYKLIMEHYRIANNCVSKDIPYLGFKHDARNDVTFDLQKLPIPLRHIIKRFVKQQTTTS